MIPTVISSSSLDARLKEVDVRSNQLAQLVGALLKEANAGSVEALSRLEALLDVGLRSPPMPSEPFCPVARGVARADLQIREVDLGTQVTFTIPKGMCGSQFINVTDMASLRSHRLQVVQSYSLLKEDAALFDVTRESTTYTFTICWESNNRTHSQQAEYLKENNLEPVPRWILTIGAALVRHQSGFFEDRSGLGATNDRGDLFRGKVVRAGDGYVATFKMGIGGGPANDAQLDYADPDVVIAGSPIPK